MGSFRLRALLTAALGAALAASLIGPLPAHGATVVDAKFAELNFDYGKHVKLVGDGTKLGDKVLFGGVLTADGTTVDAIVTTSALVNSTIYRYEQGAQAGGDPSYFQVDTRVTAKDGFASFTFEFVQAGTGESKTPVAVSLENVQISGIDIDSNQFNDFTGIQGFTWAANTRLKAIPVPTSFPANVRFLGSSATGTNDPRDQVVVTFGTLSKVTVSFGNVNRQESNYFGVAFKSIGFEQDETTSFGAMYSVNYDANGGTGTTPADQTGNLGEVVDVSGADTLRRTGYIFRGWNTAADGSGTSYSPKDPLTIPQDGLTLYAQWTPTASPSPTPSASTSASPSASPSPTTSASPSASATPSDPASASASASPSASPSQTVSASPSAQSSSASPTPSASTSPTPSPSRPVDDVTTDADTPVTIDPIDDKGLPPGTVIREVEQPQNGSAVVERGEVVYTPDQGFRGTDEFTVTVVERDGAVRVIPIEVTVGREQLPVAALALPASLRSGVNVILDKPARTNAGQAVRVEVSCTTSLRVKVAGDVRACTVRSGAQGTSVTIRGGSPLTVRVRLSAPSVGKFRAYEAERTYQVR